MADRPPLGSWCRIVLALLPSIRSLFRITISVASIVAAPLLDNIARKYLSPVKPTQLVEIVGHSTTYRFLIISCTEQRGQRVQMIMASPATAAARMSPT